jgi:phage-related minor tail protein
LITVDAYLIEKGHHPSKDGHTVIFEEISGKIQPCIGIRAQKAGHYRMVVEDIIGVSKSEIIDDGESHLREGQADDKFVQNAAHVSVNMDELSDCIDSVLQLVGGLTVAVRGPC